MNGHNDTLFPYWSTSPKRRMDARQAARFLGVSVPAISRLYSAGRLKGEFIGSVWYTTQVELERVRLREFDLIRAERELCQTDAPEYVQLDLDWDG